MQLTDTGTVPAGLVEAGAHTTSVIEYLHPSNQRLLGMRESQSDCIQKYANPLVTRSL